jgi:hypothetical protein
MEATDASCKGGKKGNPTFVERKCTAHIDATVVHVFKSAPTIVLGVGIVVEGRARVQLRKDFRHKYVRCY